MCGSGCPPVEELHGVAVGDVGHAAMPRSSQRSRYGKAGTWSRWMALMTTVPPGATSWSAKTATEPTGAKEMAASSGSAGGSAYLPTELAPREAARCCSSAERVATWTTQPRWRASWMTSEAEAPKP